MNTIVLAVLLSAVQPSPPVPRQTTDSTAATSQKIQKDTKNDQGPTDTPSPNIEMKKPTDQKAEGDRQRNHDTEHPIIISKLPAVTVDAPKRDWADWWSWGFNLLLVLIGAIGVYWAIRTVKATETAAKAALLNAQAVIYTERPWLILEQLEIKPRIDKPNFIINDLPPTDRDKHSDCIFYLKNYGRTPAIVVAQKAELQIGKHGLKPPNPAFFDNPGTIPPYVFPQDTSRPVLVELATNITHGAKELMDIRATFVWLCGLIRYKDSVPQEVGIEYETRFCYVYCENGEAFGWTPRPAEYNGTRQYQTQKAD